MKKLVQINVTCNGSTGRIMNQIQQTAENEGWEAYSFFGRGKPANEKCIKIDTKIEILCHVFISRLLNMQGHCSILATYRLIKKIKKINPNIVHLHNIHGYYINYKILLKFLAKSEIPVVWTLHDCWAFTGHCASYTSNKCNKWQENCQNCKNIKEYPKSYFEAKRSKKEFLLKEKLINDIDNITFTVPSSWLRNETKKSFLKNKNIQIIHNFIDTSIFKPTVDYTIKDKYSIPKNKKIILGVASVWTQEKGIDYFKQLSNIINMKKEIIVMVGLTKKQIKSMPSNIIGIKKIENIEDLVKLYSISNVFFNPSIQETFSMVTLEALACGVPCIVMNSTATPELIKTKECGIIEQDFDLKKTYEDIQKIMEDKEIKKRKEIASNYDKSYVKQYINLYETQIERQGE